LPGGWGDIAFLAGGLAITAIYVWWVRKSFDFAEKNPGVALLEGAELIEYQRFEAQAKGLLSPPQQGPSIKIEAPKDIEDGHA
jgi:hypothetical protein